MHVWESMHFTAVRQAIFNYILHMLYMYSLNKRIQHSMRKKIKQIHAIYFLYLSFGWKVVVKQQHMTARSMTQREIKRWQAGIIQLYCQVLAKEMHKAWQNVRLVGLALLTFAEKLQFKQLGPSLASSHIFWCIKRSPNACLATWTKLVPLVQY